MRSKDITEKTLEAYNDVFSDIVNVLLYDGETVVKACELHTAGSVSQYKSDDTELHEQERDVFKLWKNTKLCIAVFGLENQTEPDPDMPLRVIGYDGASYRSQLLNHKKTRYPVVTLVLYYGKNAWTKRSLYDCMEVPDELRPYVNDYRINLFNISDMLPEQVRKFRSDFRYVADYFVQKKKNKSYKPPKGTLRHVDETLKLLRVMTNDVRFEQHFTAEQKKRGVGMCEIVDGFVKKGEKKGRREGYREALYDLVRDNIMTTKQAAERAGVSVQTFTRGMKKAGYR